MPVLAMATALAACATTPEPNQTLEQARSQYAVLETQPGASRRAALELEAAEQSLARADSAWDNGRDPVVVDHLAYLAAQRVNIAEQAILLSEAESELENADAARTQVQLQARTAQIKSAKQEVASAERQAASAQQQATQLQAELEELQAEQTERGTVITLGDVLFDVDKAQLKPGGQRNVRQLAEFLEENGERQVLIEGFTDSTGSDEYNRGLSERRANAVRDALVDMGIDPQRIRTRGYGEQYPVASNDSAATRQLNRRVEVIISNDASQVEERR